MVAVIKKYLKISHYSNQQKEFEELFLSHPNYPSVYALTDSLDMLSIENIAAKVQKEDLQELPNSFLAIFKEDLVLVTKTDDQIALFLENEEKQIVSFNEFSRHWDGIVIVVEPNDIPEDNPFKVNLIWIKYSIPSLALIVLSFVYNSYTWNSIAVLVTSIVGLILSIFIIQEKLGFKNKIISKLCNINANTSCHSVIQSDKGEINKWFGFPDLTLIFFGANVASMLLEPLFLVPFIGLLSFLSLPIIAYSVWMQKYQLKKWCLLCLFVSLLIVFQSVQWVFEEKFLLNNVLPGLFIYVFSLVAVISTWFILKPILEQKIKTENALNELKKFKKNYSIFNFLSKEITVKKELNELGALHFGINTAKVVLTIVLSPSCKHCYKAFEDAFELVSKFSERISLYVLFNINPENDENPFKAVVENVLAINNSNPEKITEALSDWYIQKMRLDQWLAKWKMKIIDMKINYQIRQQYYWCSENGFNYTPVKIINGKLFPNEYDVIELKYFLNDFEGEEEIMKKEVPIQI